MNSPHAAASDGAFLILKAVLDPLENFGDRAFFYIPFAVCATERFAQQFCNLGRELTKRDCWAIFDHAPEFKYQPIPSLASVYEGMMAGTA